MCWLDSVVIYSGHQGIKTIKDLFRNNLKEEKLLNVFVTSNNLNIRRLCPVGLR